MDMLRRLFGSRNTEPTKVKTLEELTQELSLQLPAVTQSKAAVQRYKEANPLIAAMGMPLFMDAPPPGFEARLNAKLAERDTLEEQLFRARKEEESIRAQAALGLGELRDSRAVQPLIIALKDEYTLVRTNAAEALGRIGDRGAIEPLTELIQTDSNEVVRKAARQSLEMIRGINT